MDTSWKYFTPLFRGIFTVIGLAGLLVVLVGYVFTGVFDFLSTMLLNPFYPWVWRAFVIIIAILLIAKKEKVKKKYEDTVCKNRMLIFSLLGLLGMVLIFYSFAIAILFGS